MRSRLASDERSRRTSCTAYPPSLGMFFLTEPAFSTCSVANTCQSHPLFQKINLPGPVLDRCFSPQRCCVVHHGDENCNTCSRRSRTQANSLPPLAIDDGSERRKRHSMDFQLQNATNHMVEECNSAVEAIRNTGAQGKHSSPLAYTYCCDLLHSPVWYAECLNKSVKRDVTEARTGKKPSDARQEAVMTVLLVLMMFAIFLTIDFFYSKAKHPVLQVAPAMSKTGRDRSSA